MNNENTATAMAVSEPSALETRSMVRLEFTPESFAADIDREKQMRAILQKYMCDAMIKDHHFYSFSKDAKPALTQEGAHSLCSLMKAIIGPPSLEKEYHGDHLTVTARVEIFNQHGERIATGDGICSTRESKYAYRWAYDNELPKDFDGSGLKTKSGTGKNGRPWTSYQIPNQDLPDLYNTVLKMAVKRAKVAAVRQLPLVSEIFTAEEHDGEELTKQPAERAIVTRSPKTSPVPQKAEVSEAEIVTNLVNKLVEKGGITLDDLQTQFLPEGVKTFADLEEDYAAAIKPTIVELLNAAVAKK